MSSADLVEPVTAQSSQITTSAIVSELTSPDAAGTICIPRLGYYPHSLPNKDQGIQSEFNFSLEAGIPLRNILAELNRLNIANGHAPVLSGLLLSDRRFDYTPEAEKTFLIFQLSRGYFPDPADGQSNTMCSLIEPAPLEIAAAFLALYSNEFSAKNVENDFSSSYFLRSTVFLTSQGALAWSPEGMIQTNEVFGPYSAMLCMPKNSVPKNLVTELS